MDPELQKAVDAGLALPLMEAFYTIQGEGYYKGSAAYFIRIGGCDVGCHWCDVKESWDASLHPPTYIADIVDQASSYTDKNVEMKAINRQIKLISEIDKALARIREDIYGYCLDTAEPIGLKRLMARPVAKYTIAAQEKHEKDEKVHADD